MLSNTIKTILAFMLVVYIALMYITLNFNAFLNGLVHLSTTSNNDLADGVCKIFVTLSFCTCLVTNLLEGLGQLWKHHFVNQSVHQVDQPISQPVEQTNPDDVDALSGIDVAEIKRELERASNHQLQLERELELEHGRRLGIELQVELERKIHFATPIYSVCTDDDLAGIDVADTVTADSSECVISDADFFAEQQRIIQDALGNPSAQITWGEFKSEPTREQLELARLEREVAKFKIELLEHERKIQRTFALARKLWNSKCKRQRQQHLGSTRMHALGNGR